MTHRTRLTEPRVRAFEHEGEPGGVSFLWDDEITGLAVRASARGKVFIFQGRPRGGNSVRYKIGPAGAGGIPLADARREALRLAASMAKGEDPRDAVRARRAEARRKRTTVKELWTAWIEANRNQWGDRHYQDTIYLSREPDGVMFPLLSLPVTAIDAPALIRWAEAETKKHADKVAEAERRRKENAERKPERRRKNPCPPSGHATGKNAALRQGFARLKACWRWAYGRPEDFGKLPDPAMFNRSDLLAVIPSVSPARDSLERGHLPAWFKAVGEIQNPVIRAYLQILLLTGARRNELGDLKWTDVEFQWRSIHMKDKVDAEGRTIPMTPYVEHLLSQLPRRNEWVFSSEASDNGRMNEPRIAHRRALAVAGVPHVTIHGLRRSFGSLAEWVDLPAGVVAQLMGHKPSATAEKHYRIRPLDLLRVHHEKLESWILEQAGVPFDPEAARSGLRLVKDDAK